MCYLLRPDQNDQMKLLLEVSKAIAAEKETAPLAQVIVDGITKLTMLKSAAIYLLKDNKLYLQATFPPLPPGFPEVLRIAEVKDHPHIGKAVSSKQPVVLEDSKNEALTGEEKEVCEQRQLRSILYVPLTYQGKVIGVLIPASIGITHKITEDDINICQTLAGHAALSLSEAMLAEEKKIYIAEIEAKNQSLILKEKAIRESEEKYRRLFETMAQGVVYQAADGTIISANPAAEKILGLSLDQMQGKSSLDPGWKSIREDGSDFPGEEHAAMVALRTGKKVGPLIMGVYHPQKQEHVWLSINATPLFKPGETKPYQVYATFDDITERKQAEEAHIREKYEKELVVNNLTEQVAFLDLEMNIVWVNSEVIKRHNLQSKDYIGEKCYKVYHQLSKPCPDCAIIDVFKTGQPSGGIHKSPDGCYWQMAGTPIFDKGGKMIGVLDTSLDVTDLKLAEQALKESETRFQRMLKVIPDMVSVHDPEMNIVYSNWNGFAAIPADKQVLNTKCYKTYRNYDQICPDCKAVGVLESNDAFEAEVELSMGYWIDLRVIPLLDSNGKVEYFIEWVRDISNLKKIEEELRLFNIGLEEKVKERTALLETSNRELDAFSYSVSHDLRSPLNRIQGFSQALLEDYSKQLDKQGQDYLRRIGNSSQHMVELIDAMLKLSKVSRVKINREPVEISTLVSFCLQELQFKEPQRNLEALIKPGLVVEGDTALLRIVIENLISNAWKFTRQEEKTRIEFGLTEIAGQPTYFIRDNGAGFDMKHASKLFTPFQRLHSEQDFSGTGIGLSIVSRIINHHGGEIWAEGEDGKGACFYFTL
jgi:PAS domain S-box-containing protein